MRRKIFTIASLIALTVLTSSCIIQTNKHEAQVKKTEQTDFYPIPPLVPDSLTFGGETVKLDREDLVERLDRELMSVTYNQITTLLILRRAGKIFPRIEPILRKHGLPDDLKYLAVIESSLNPAAHSRAGAAGLWQFMPVTALEYGLEISPYVDERYNIEKETEVACEYLKRAHKRFGDWMTTAASYNAGMGGIGRRLNEQLAENGMDLWLVEETSQYMFRLLSAKMLFDNPENFGFRVTEKDRYPYQEPKIRLCVDYPIADLPTFAKENNCPYVALRRANLWLRSDALPNPTRKRYTIIIPQN
ncbi:MAG: lytic transglycosylase domain-containing protein [Prevotellaceae bacterium]|nr:lytic transglycosylase domain-containing protein [Prevotellaceae bacterium]